MAETNPEHRHVRSDERLRVLDGVGQRRRIAGAVAQENAVGLLRRSSGGGRRRRIDADVEAAPQPAQDVSLMPKLAAAGFCGVPAGGQRDAGTRRSSSGQSNASVGDAADQIQPSICGNRAGALDDACGSSWLPVAITPRITPDRSWRRARADVGDRDDPVGDQVVAQRHLRARLPPWAFVVMMKPATRRARLTSSLETP
jgi:hypothetical protein